MSGKLLRFEQESVVTEGRMYFDVSCVWDVLLHILLLFRSE